MILLQHMPITSGVSVSGLLPSVILIIALILSTYFSDSQSNNLPLCLFFESMLVIWCWQGILHYLAQNYSILLHTGDPALMQLNEIIHYRLDLKLNLLEIFFVYKSLVVLTAMLSELGIFALMIRKKSEP